MTADRGLNVNHKGTKAPREHGGASLGQLLEGVLAGLDMGAKVGEHLAVAAWPGIAGGVVAGHTRAEVVRDGVLVVAADSPAWAQELQMRKGELLSRLAAQVGEGVVRDIHFRSGLRREKGERSKGAGERTAAEIRLSDGEIREAREAAGRIEDGELRARAERAFLSLARMSRWREEAGWRRCERCGQWQRTGRRWCGSCLHARHSAK